MSYKGNLLNPLAIALLYVVFATVWIIYSDQFLLFIFQEIEGLSLFQTLKGLFFVVTSGCMIYWLTMKYEKKNRYELEYTNKILQHSPLAIAILDKNANTTYINEQGAELIGASQQDILGNRLMEMPYQTLHLDGRELKLEETFHSRVMETGEVIQNERYLLRLSDGSEKFVSGSAAPIFDTDGNIESVILIVADKTEKILAENALRIQEERYRLLVDSSPFGIAIHQKGKLIYVNPAGCKMMEAENVKELLGKGVRDLIHPSHHSVVEKRKEQIVNGASIEYPLEEKLITLKGNLLHVEVVASVFQFNGEKAIQVIATDISDRVERENILRKTLAEKEVLISEMHHRVKNNMAIVSGLIQMQALESSDKKVNRVLYDSVRRIQSIAMIHEELYHHQDLQNIRFDRHIMRMVDYISRDFEEVNVNVHFDLDEIEINVNQAVPCALLVNEAVTNVYRHAFNVGESGEMHVGFTHSDGKVRIQIKDNGKGFSEKTLTSEKPSFGVQLLQITTEQLHGTLKIENKNGTSIFVEFDMDSRTKGSSANLVD